MVPHPTLPLDRPEVEVITPRPTRVRFLLLLWLCVAAIIIYIQRNAISVLAPQMQTDLSLTNNQMSAVMSAFYWSYGLAQIPMGILCQYLGSRRGLILSMTMASVLCGLMAVSSSFYSILFFWMMTGIAAALVFPCCVQAFSHWFPKSGLSLPSGIFTSSMSVGGAISAALTGMLLLIGASEVATVANAPESVELAAKAVAATPEAVKQGFFNWRSIYVLYMLPGFAWVVLFGLWFRNYPADHRSVNAGELALINEGTDSNEVERTPQRIRLPWGKLLASKQMLLLGGQQLFRNAGYIFIGTWFPTYVMSVYKISIETAGVLAMFPLFGVVAGAASSGALSDWLLKKTGSRVISRQYVGGFGQLFCAISLLLGWWTSNLGVAVALFSFGAFSMSFGSCCSYTVVMENCRPHVGPAFGMMNMAGNIGGALSPLLAGIVATTFDWESVILMYVGMYVLAFFGWMLMNTENNFFTEESIK